jgi:hypothetical protein
MTAIIEETTTAAHAPAEVQSGSQVAPAERTTGPASEGRSRFAWLLAQAYTAAPLFP